MSTTLPELVRGETFDYSFTLLDWVGSDFTGGVKFIIRKNPPKSTASTNLGPDVICLASTAEGEITFSSAVGTILIHASKTRKWPVGTWYWELEGKVSGANPIVKKIDYGTIQILPDYIRV